MHFMEANTLESFETVAKREVLCLGKKKKTIN